MTVKPERSAYSISRRLKEFRDSAGRSILKLRGVKDLSVAGPMSDPTSASSSPTNASVAGAGGNNSSLGREAPNRRVSGVAGATGLEIANAGERTPRPEVAAPKRNRSLPFNVDQLKYENLKPIQTLGSGAFGRVDLVKDSVSGAFFAMKSISKVKVTQKEKHLGYLFNEKKALAELSDRFVVKLYKTFNIQDRCCFLLEPVLGGELFVHMRRMGVLTESTARYYAACVVLAFEEFHSNGFVYRDLKPENLVLREDGQLVFVDFGFCKPMGRRQRSKSVIGTPEYLPPEVCALEGHGKGYDLWTLGVLIYEMLARVTPFYKSDKKAMYKKIKDVDYRFPAGFPSKAADLVDRLLRRQDFCRLGDRNTTEIKQHPWFAGFDWEALADGKLKAPIQPRMRYEKDGCRYEHKFNTTNPMPFPPYNHAQQIFEGF